MYAATLTVRVLHKYINVLLLDRFDLQMYVNTAIGINASRKFFDNVKYTSLVDKIFFKNDDSHELIVFDHESKEAMQQVAVIAQKLYFLRYLFINWL